MNEPKFKVGDKVRVLDGAGIHNYYGYWVSSMVECVGKVYEVDDVRLNRKTSSLYYNKYAYKLKGLDWNFDERGLKLAEDEEPYGRITIYREGRKVIAKNELTGEKGVARCSPEDEFNFKYGARLALSRLTASRFKPGDKVVAVSPSERVYVKTCRGWKGTVEEVSHVMAEFMTVRGEDGSSYVVDPVYFDIDNTPEYFTGKAVYVGKKYLRLFTKGKIYEFENGKGFYDDGSKIRVGAFKSVDELNAWLEEEGFVEIVE